MGSFTPVFLLLLSVGLLCIHVCPIASSAPLPSSPSSSSSPSARSRRVSSTYIPPLASYDEENSPYQAASSSRFDDNRGSGGASRSLLAISPLRQRLTAGTLTPSTTLKQSAMSFCRNFPRRSYNLQSMPSTIPQIRRDDGTIDSDGAKDYGFGLIFSFMLPLIFGIVTLLSCLTFCMARACCDSCGGRHAHVKFSAREVNTSRGLIFGFLILMFIIFGIGFTANSGVSQAIDGFYVEVDAFVNYLYGFHTVAQSAVDVVNDALVVFQRLNTTIVLTIPTTAQVVDYKACVDNIFYLVEAQKNITRQVLLLDAGVRATANFTTIAITIGQFDAAIKSLPSLTGLNANLVALNASISALPDMFALADDLFAVNASLRVWSASANLPVNAAPLYVTSGVLRTGPVATQMFRQALVLTVGTGTMPNLGTVYGDIASSPTATDQTMVQNDLNPIQTAIDQLPPTSQSLQELVIVNQTIWAIRATMGVKTEIYTLNNSIATLPNLNLLADQLEDITTFTSTTTVEPMMAAVKQAQGAIAAVPSIDGMIATVNDIEAGVANVRGAGLDSTIRSLITFNSSISGLVCITRIFDKLRQINNSIFILPDSVQELFVQEPEITRQVNNLGGVHEQVTEGYNKLLSLNDSLNGLPDFATLRTRLYETNDSLNSIPDLDSAYTDLKAFNESLHAMPDFTPFVQNLRTLATYVARATTIRDLANSVLGIEMALAALPDIKLYTDFVTSLGAQLTAINPPLTSCRTAANSNQATYLATFGNQKNQLRAQLMTFHNLRVLRPLESSLTTPLNALNRSIAGLPPALNVSLTVLGLKLVADNFPDLTELHDSLVATGVSIRDQTTFRNLIGDGTLLQLNASLQSLPDLAAMKQTAIDSQNTISATNLSAVVAQIDVPDYLNENQRTEALARFDQMEEFRPYQIEMADKLDTFKTNGQQVQDAADKMTTYRNDYYLKRNTYYLQTDSYDRIRLVVFNTLIFIPLLLTLCGFCSCVTKRGGPSMFMALTFFPITAFFFLLGGIQMPVSIMLSDFCKDPDGLILSNLGNMTFNTSSLSQFTNSSEVLTADAVFRYFTRCEGSRPAMLQVLSDPQAILAAQGINFTTQLNDITHGTGGNSSFQLAEPILDIFDSLLGLEDDVIATVKALGVQLNCRNSSNVYQPFRHNICANFVGSLALNTGMYLLAAICMCPGMFIGIRAYKRHDPRNAVGDKDATAAAGDAEPTEGDDDMDDHKPARGSVSGRGKEYEGGAGSDIPMQPMGGAASASPHGGIHVSGGGNAHMTVPAPLTVVDHGHGEAQFVPVQPVIYEAPAEHTGNAPVVFTAI